MLFLQLKSGEYLTIGGDIAVQVFQETGNRIRVGIAAPQDLTVLRGEVRERNGEDRPDCLRELKCARKYKSRPEPKEVSSG